VVVLAGGLVACGCGLLAGPSVAMQRLDEVGVKGYHRTQTESSTWAGSVEATGTFVGPPQRDIPSLVSGQRAELKPVAPVPPLTGPPPRPLIFLKEIFQGSMSGGGDCFIVISQVQLQNGNAPFSVWNVSEADAARVRSGRAEVLRVTVNCGKG
jgi:hypothetical protein